MSCRIETNYRVKAVVIKIKLLKFVMLVTLICAFTINIQAQENQQEKKKTSVTQKKLENILKEITEEVKKEVKKSNRSEESKGYSLEIDRLIIDETKTKIGRDFYDIFFTFWKKPQGIKDYTIYIKERAHPRFGSWVWINIDDKIVYQNVLRPRYDVIEEASKAGVNATIQFLYRRNQDEKQLLEEDMSGRGVY